MTTSINHIATGVTIPTTIGSISQLSHPTIATIGSSTISTSYESSLKRQLDKEKELREKYPAIKTAYEQYQHLLKLTGEL
jgi:hypothetical protein